jgi:ActR/RegA family two-component response regulator
MTRTEVKNEKIIAIVDDDKSLAETTAWDVEEAGYQPFLLKNEHFHNVNELASLIIENSQGAVCDHRLSNSGFANFFGAELVAALYDRKFPSLLITQYTEMDTSFSIRKWRHKIPVLLSREEADASTISRGIEVCKSELYGKIPSTRKSRRTIVSITNIDQESGEMVVDAFVPSWNPYQAVRFPASLVPEHLRDILKPDVYLFAHVNTGAEKSDDLYFEKFELAPEPDEDDGLA